ncbi:hypothetical protein BT93_C2445 [Corymbia citriodora subsp. variegata]|nr:hypothetical protein BT93_C2445 [Corymbia citriodora subsp. variegata]
MVRQHVSTAQLSEGSASSVSLASLGKCATPVLALPAVNQDPFAASWSIPPPSYVQMAEMEKKQHFVVQEQQLWKQHATEGMRSQATLAKIRGAGYYAPGHLPAVPFGMPTVNGM